MRGISLLGVAAVLASAVVAVPAAQPMRSASPSAYTAPPPHTLIAYAEVWRTHIRLTAAFSFEYWPPYCGVGSDDDVCSAFETGDAELVVQVVHRGRLIYREIEQAYDNEWRGRIYLWELTTEIGRCSPGRYMWTITLRDPAGRSMMNVSDRGRFTVRCS